MISSEQEYLEALDKVNELLDKNPSFDSEEGKELDALVDEIYIYECQFFKW